MNMRQWCSAVCAGLLLIGMAGCGAAGRQTSLPVSQSAPVVEVTSPVVSTTSREAASPYKTAQYTPVRDPFKPAVATFTTASGNLPGSAAPLARSPIPGVSAQNPAAPVLLTVYVENGVKRVEIVNGGQYYEKTEGESFDGYLVQRIDTSGTVTVVKDGRAQVLNIIPSGK